MAYAEHAKHMGLRFEPEQHAVLASASRSQPGELAHKLLTHSCRVGGQRNGHELDHRLGDLAGKLVEVSPHRVRDLDVPAHRGASP